MKRAWPWLALAIAACGGEEAAESRFSFRRHALACEAKGIEAKLQITGVDGYCPLQVNSDNTVTGRCPAVPTGAVRTFRLVYFVNYQMSEVQLATALQMLDLTGETRSAITIDFPADEVDTSYDDDGDGLTNLLEICMGRNPLIRDL